MGTTCRGEEREEPVARAEDVGRFFAEKMEQITLRRE